MKCATDEGAVPASGGSSAGRLCSTVGPLTASKVTVRIELSRVSGRSLEPMWPTATGCRLVNWAAVGVLMGVTVMLLSPTELDGEGEAVVVGSARTTTCRTQRGHLPLGYCTPTRIRNA